MASGREMNVTERFIFCDGCGHNNNGDDRVDFPNFYFMIKWRKKEGWVFRGKKALCPECAAKK